MGASSPCPICGRAAASGPNNPFRPFCTNRCKVIDLERWLSGTYRVPGPPVESSLMSDADPGDRLLHRNGAAHDERFLTSDGGDEEP